MTCAACRAENDASATNCSACGAALSTNPTSMVVTVNLSPGVLFHSRYEILGPLGRGGMGMVYKARDRTLDEDVAIKILRPDFADDPRMAQRFKSEIKLARKVRHKNVCAIHDFGEERGVMFISMELIEGVDLKQVIKASGGLRPDQAYDAAIQIAEGLQAVHDAGIIHRDLKTPNVMLGAHGVARLMDFGVAKREDGLGGATATGHVLGTPDYMSPEQAQGMKVDHRCDIYALGIVIYEIFSGRVPFHGETPISTILKHLHDPPPLEDPQAIGIPHELRPILRKALAKAPADRHDSASQVAEALRQARLYRARSEAPTDATNTPTLAAPIPLPAPATTRPAARPPAKVPARAPRLVWPVAAGVLAAGAGASLLIWINSNRPPPSEPTPLKQAAASSAPTSSPAASRSPSPQPTATPPAEPAHMRTIKLAPAAAARTTQPTPKRDAEAPLASSPEVASVSPAPIPVTAPTPQSTPQAEAAGWLQVAPRPYGDIYVDGKLAGTWPIDRIPLTAGDHRVRFEHPSYEPFERTIRISEGETAKLGFDFVTQGTRKR